ncbi:hypothetical protein PRZ48_011877 [Zasmidium cellare]|uniref:Phosphatidylglycerol/phosphatidylinositol transfer protein n=1 Tax=Zasmidium cellare TaxID=395010 RepID=A0ABR0E889_ZASCE|nr:hypothetical protein PRZ48_011877 [Zasmidium cellare]
MMLHWILLAVALILAVPSSQAQPSGQKPLSSIQEDFRAELEDAQKSIPGNSTFKQCSLDFTNDILDINWVTLIPKKAHIGHGIQLMVNGTLTEDVSKNATIRVHLAKKGSRFNPLEIKWKFCDPLEEVMQEDGPRCPPKKGGVEITGHAFVWWVSAGDVIETTIEALTPTNTTIACLYGEVDVVRQGEPD